MIHNITLISLGPFPHANHTREKILDFQGRTQLSEEESSKMVQIFFFCKTFKNNTSNSVLNLERTDLGIFEWNAINMLAFNALVNSKDHISTHEILFLNC